MKKLLPIVDDPDELVTDEQKEKAAKWFDKIIKKCKNINRSKISFLHTRLYEDNEKQK